MFCKNCGVQLSDDMAFCHKCGTAVAPAKAEEPMTEKTTPDTNENMAGEAYNNVTSENPQPIYQMPQYTAPVEEVKDDKKGFSTASLILGICSFLPCCCVNFITAILAVIFGFIGIKSSNKTMSIIGIILAAVAFVIYLIAVIVYLFVLEANVEEFTYFFDNNMYY